MTSSKFLRRARVATSMIFFIDGAVLAIWATNIPNFKNGLGLSDSELGWALSAFAIGTMTVMGLAGAVVTRIGSRATILLGGLTLAMAMPLCAVAGTVWQLAGAIFCIGAFTSVLDVAMNTHGTMIEVKNGRPMMSSFHAIYSVGGLCGASIVAALLSTTLGMEQCMWISGAATVAIVCVAMPFLGKIEPELDAKAVKGKPARLLAWPNRALLSVAALTVLTMFIERIITDWSSLFMTDVSKIDAGEAAFAFAAFSLAMAVGRLAGDASITRWGGEQVVVFCGLIGALGLAMMVISPLPLTATIGFVLAGLGLANMAPMLYSRASRVYPGTPALGVALNGTIGYAGYFVASPLMGALSSSSGLRFAMIVPMVAFVLLALSQWRAARKPELARA